MSVLIAGCGDLGTEAGLRFAVAGHRVMGWRRSPELLPSSIEGTAVDLSGELPAVPADTDILVIAIAADERTEAAYRAAYVQSVARILAALRRDAVQPRRLIFVSSTTVYGQDASGTVDEETPTAPTTATGLIIQEAEEQLLAQFPNAIVLRLAGIYGPGRTRLIDGIRNGSARISDFPQITNRIHRDDAARAIVHLATGVGSPSSIYLGVDDAPTEQAEVLRFIADRLGLPHPPTDSTASSRGGNRSCANARLRATGFTFTYPTYREGYRAILEGTAVRHP